ncbi:MAG: redoxin domain-containing protein [Chloroflexota bacterium]
MKLAAGTLAPAFETEDIFGQPVVLHAAMQNPVLLSFYRNGACALCNLQVHKLIQKYPAYHAQGLNIIAVFESPSESVLQYVGKQDAPFPIIADPDAHLYELFGVETSEAKAMANLNNPKQAQHVQEAEAIGYKLTREEGSNFYRMPADFLICPDLTIQSAFYSDVVGDHLAFDEIEAFLQEHMGFSPVARFGAYRPS